MSKFSSLRGNAAAPDPFAFRPTTYIADATPEAAILQNIVGEARRTFLREHFRQILWRRVEPISSDFLESHLEPSLRERWVAYDPFANSPGEFLPPYLRGEVEIARVVVPLAPSLVFSVRARRAGGRLRYRMVDAHRTAFALERQSSVRPLTARELVDLIEGATPDMGQPCTNGLSEFLVRQLRHRTYSSTLKRWFAIRVSSDVYPRLDECFARHVINRITEQKYERSLKWGRP